MPLRRNTRRKNAGEKRLAARHDVLEHATEAMLALIRLHVAECPACAQVICAGGMQDLIRKIDEELRVAAEKVTRTTAAPSAPRPRPVKRARGVR